MGAEMELSAPRQNVGTWYEIPLDPPLTDKLRFTSGYQFEDLVDTESKLLTLGGEWQHKLDSGWQRAISLNWQREEFKLGDDSGLSSFLMPGIGWSILQADNKVDPARGYRLQLAVKGAKEGALADADLVHVSALAKGVTSFLGGHRLLGRVQVGGIATNDFDVIPPSLRFYAGGDQSVRGYDYQTLSPENSDGDKIGARYMVAGSVEYQFPIAERWRVAAFVDEGNAFDSLNAPQIKTGVGIGVRWVSPVGPLRLDLANGLDEGGGFRIHFSMGPEL
ncbi:Translocation and assembly module subunit TamA [compost metagenome]